MGQLALHKTGVIKLDANDLIKNEEFFCADCVVIGSESVRGYTLENNKIKVDKSIIVDENDMTDIFQNFSVESNGVCYAGGEASAHGSCGFFFKRTGDRLDWALMSQESNPFVGVNIEHDRVSFVSTSGAKWVVHRDDIANVMIEK